MEGGTTKLYVVLVESVHHSVCSADLFNRLLIRGPRTCGLTFLREKTLKAYHLQMSM